MKIEPLADRVIVKRAEAETKSRGGILLPQTCLTESLEGHIVAVGEGRLLENGDVVPLEVKEGDRVLFASKYSGTEVDLDGVTHLIMNEDDLLAVYED
jgi:chaperonin GroES